MDAEAGAGRATAKRAKGAAATGLQVDVAEPPAAGSPRAMTVEAAAVGTTTTSTARIIHLTRPAGWTKRRWKNYKQNYGSRTPKPPL